MGGQVKANPGLEQVFGFGLCYTEVKIKKCELGWAACQKRSVMSVFVHVLLVYATKLPLFSYQTHHFILFGTPAKLHKSQSFDSAPEISDSYHGTPLVTSTHASNSGEHGETDKPKCMQPNKENQS